MDLKNLNENQRKAVEKTQGPLLILAGAGSGKTKVITHKIAYLIKEKHINAYNILAITFTNKAAREMKERVRNIIGDLGKNLWINTFHSFCNKILRIESNNIPYENNFTIFDSADKLNLIKKCALDLGLNLEKKEYSKVASDISFAKDNMISPSDYLSKYVESSITEKISKIYYKYQEELIKNNAMDFDDLIYNTIILFRNNKSVLEKYQEKFKYIMVDEYQDTNTTQYLLVKMLSEKYNNISVVGDDDQSIYTWRGADIRNILEFEKDFKNVEVIKLEQNYRSTSNIINAARGLITKNNERKNKRIWTDSEEGDKIKVFEAYDENDEANFIAKSIKKMVINENHKYSDFAILYRVNALSRKYEDYLMKYAIPYKIYGGLKFYDRAEIKDIIAYLRLINNNNDDVAFRRIVNVPKRSIGPKTIEKLEEYALENEISLLDSIKEIDNILGKSKAKDNLINFYNLIENFKNIAEKEILSNFFDKLLKEIDYKAMIENLGDKALSKLENINEFKSVIKEFENINEDKTLSNFLQNASLSTDMDEDVLDKDFVNVMTIHSSKGLEFPVVFISALEKGIFPSYKNEQIEEKLEEERRLCYVAITRAKEKLYMTYAKKRLLYGKANYNFKSQFIDEIDETLIENIKNNSVQVQPVENKSKTNINDFVGKFGVNRTSIKNKIENQEIKTGSKVKHKVFGIGNVIGKQGSKYTIVFENKGIKTIDASVVKLEII